MAEKSRKERATELFMEGYNCAQSVFLAFEDLHGMERSAAAALSSSFGAGMGRLREVCGTVSGMFLAAGVLYGYDSPVAPQEKAEHYARIQELAAEFEKRNKTIVCRKLLGLDVKREAPVPEARTKDYYKKRPCPALAGCAAEILDDYIKAHPIPGARLSWKTAGVRPAGQEDLEELLVIYARARAFMAASGNPGQWGESYPPREVTERDIAEGNCYVLEAKGVIQAVFAYFEGEDPTYGRIEDGAWKQEGAYATVHRLASAGNGRGAAALCFDWCADRAKADGCGSLRADTHADNQPMQRALAGAGFARCGRIYLENGEPRLAYERTFW